MFNQINDYGKSINDLRGNSTKKKTKLNANIQNNSNEIIIDFSGNEGMKAIIYSEILGKPMCKRRRGRVRN